jgi:hypothetical protein
MPWLDELPTEDLAEAATKLFFGFIGRSGVSGHSGDTPRAKYRPIGGAALSLRRHVLPIAANPDISSTI